MTVRIIWGISYIVLILILPWYLSALIGLLLLLRYENFFEIIIGAFLVDVLYGVPLPQYAHFTLVLTLSATVCFFLRRLAQTYLFNG